MGYAARRARMRVVSLAYLQALHRIPYWDRYNVKDTCERYELDLETLDGFARRLDMTVTSTLASNLRHYGDGKLDATGFLSALTQYRIAGNWSWSGQISRDSLNALCEQVIAACATLPENHRMDWPYLRLSYGGFKDTRAAARVLRDYPQVFARLIRKNGYATKRTAQAIRKLAKLAKHRGLNDEETFDIVERGINRIASHGIGERSEERKRFVFKIWRDWKAINRPDIDVPKRTDEIARLEDRQWRKSYGKRSGRPASASLVKAYSAGSKLADLAWYVVNHLAEASEATDSPIVIYGRDCEVFYALMREFRPDIPCTYVLAPRPLTTSKGSVSNLPEGYEAYLRRNIPDNAIHFDSGFSGSIPRWVRNTLKIPLKGIALISSEIPECAMFGDASQTSRMRQIVLDDIEHATHRLVESNEDCWRQWHFDNDVAQYWARLSGMRDGYRAILNGFREVKPMRDIAGADITREPAFFNSPDDDDDNDDE